MIQGFDSETQPLNEQEMSVIPAFVRSLLLRRGKSNAVASKQIIDGINYHCGIRLSGPRVRKIINHIRTHDLLNGEILCANSNGYYIAADKEEAAESLNGLASRIQAQQAVFNALCRQYNRKYNNHQ